MLSLQRTIPSGSLPATLTRLDMYERPLQGFLRAVFLRQTEDSWSYCAGQCVLAGGGANSDLSEVYANFAFVSLSIDHRTLKDLLDDLTGPGISMPDGLPPLRLAQISYHWTEEALPTHAGSAMTPFRRFSVSISPGIYIPDIQLADFKLPYRRSAAAYVKEFLSYQATHGDYDGSAGSFIITIPDRRGAIRFAGGLLSIRDPLVPLRLTGSLDGKEVDLRNNDVLEYGEDAHHEADLYLLTRDGDIVDFLSTSRHPHKYQKPTAEREHERQEEQRYTQLIANGEGEVCEFKPYTDTDGSKAFELEKTVCAFSNQRGGMLFIGVDADGDIVGLTRALSKRPKGLETPADYEIQVRTRLREFLKDNQCFESKVVSIGGIVLIAVEVRQSAELNYVTRGEAGQTAFVRHGATSFKMSPGDIQARTLVQHGGQGAPSSLWRGVGNP